MLLFYLPKYLSRNIPNKEKRTTNLYVYSVLGTQNQSSGEISWKSRGFTKVSYVFQWNIDFFTHNNDFTQIYSSIPEHWLGCCSSSSSNVLLNYRIDVFLSH